MEEGIKMEKEKKAEKAKKAKKAKKSKYPDWYIGPPKPMRPKFEFKKPGPKFWIWTGITVAFLGFCTYILIRLINVGKVVQPPFDYYDLELDPEAFKDMEITISPEISVANKTIVEALIQQYNPSATLKESILHGNL